MNTTLEVQEQRARGKTPAEAAGITIEGANKWEMVIKNASHEKMEKES